MGGLYRAGRGKCPALAFSRGLAHAFFMGVHPCQSCGACCAFFRVSFYWREAEASSSPRAVPLSLTEDYSDTQRNMRGTNQKHPRCVALEGRVGSRVGCAIYESRPSPCRAFAASYEDGTPNPRCDQARAAFDLRPLKRSDWPHWGDSDPLGSSRAPLPEAKEKWDA